MESILRRFPKAISEIDLNRAILNKPGKKLTWRGISLKVALTQAEFPIWPAFNRSFLRGNSSISVDW